VRAADGTIAIIDPPGSTYTYAFGINNKGVVTGDYSDGGDDVHSYIRSADGAIKSFDPPGATNSISYGINDKGSIVGGFYLPNDTTFHGFVRSR